MKLSFFVGGLKDGTTNAMITQYFDKYGTSVEVNVPYDKTGKRKGFGFVTFNADAGVAQKINKMKHEINGHEVTVKPKVADTLDDTLHQQNVKKVFVRGFPDACTEDTLWQHFQKYGPIESTTVVRAKNGESRGFGFVIFQNSQSARAAYTTPNEIMRTPVSCQPKIGQKPEKLKTAVKRELKIAKGELPMDAKEQKRAEDRKVFKEKRKAKNSVEKEKRLTSMGTTDKKRTSDDVDGETATKKGKKKMKTE